MKTAILAATLAVIVGTFILPAIPNADANPCDRNPKICQ